MKTAATICMCLLLCTRALAGALPKQQCTLLFVRANDAFSKANTTADSRQRDLLYQQAILDYQKIINQGGIKNAKLYYNLANAFLLKGDIGRAILSYRRAENLDAGDANILKNLAFARSRRVDQIQTETKEEILRTLLFWHYDFLLKTRFLLGCIFFAVLCLSLTLLIWTGRRAPAVPLAVIAAVLFVCVAGSVIIGAAHEASTISGVITASQVVARQGDGQNYPASFKDPLHEGTEFDLLEQRPQWYHIRLANGSDAWIPRNAAELI
jgi:hypothetical protein